MHPTKFRFIWQSGFREDFLEINQSETRIVCGGHVFVDGSGQNEQSQQKTFHRCFLLSLVSLAKRFQ
jgi:hypothetical protein